MPQTSIGDIEVIAKTSIAEFIEVDLHVKEKKLVLELAGFLVVDEVTQADLKNDRKKWIRFRSYAVSQIIGELSYHCNRSKSVAKSERLNALCCHFENALSAAGR